MAKALTLRTLSDDQLLDELDSAKKELFNLRFSFATGQLDNSAQVSATKRDIARIHTVLREREIAAADLQASLSNDSVQGSAAASVGGSPGSRAVPAGSTNEPVQDSPANSAAASGDQS